MRCGIGSISGSGCWSVAARPGTPPHPAPRRRVVLRPARRHRKGLLDRCSVFAGGFDLQSACAVMGSDDDFATLDLLDALVRKSLLVADRSSGRTRFSMLETIRQFAEEQLVASGGRPRFGPPTRATSPDAKPTSWPCGTAPASVRPTTGSLSNWPICAPRFGGPPTKAILMSPPPSPPMRGCSALGRNLRADRLG